MVNIKLVIEYDGTNYCGFQKQKGQPTVQGCLEKCLTKFAETDVKITGAGRTDSGVHATGQVVNFYSNLTVPALKLPLAINSYLPQDIRVISADYVPNNFHARYDALAKTYIYKIYHSPFQSVFYRNYAVWVKKPLHWKVIEEACQYLVGTHDFAGFATIGGSVKTTVRTLKVCHVVKQNGLFVIHFTGSGFLYNMVRTIVGTLFKIGKNKWPITRVNDILRTGNRALAGPTAPPQGLYLTSVSYPKISINED